jgi:hypothetical protein
LLGFALEALVQREHPGKLDGIDAVPGVTLVAFRPFVGVVVAEDGVAADDPEVQAVIPAARVRLCVGRVVTSTTYPSSTSCQSAMVV